MTTGYVDRIFYFVAIRGYLRIRLDPELETLLKYAAEQRYMTVSAYVREALREVLGAGGTVVDRVGIETMAGINQLAAQTMLTAFAEACETAKQRLTDQLSTMYGIDP